MTTNSNVPAQAPPKTRDRPCLVCRETFPGEIDDRGRQIERVCKSCKAKGAWK